MDDKYGSYIQKLMSVILDEEQEEFNGDEGGAPVVSGGSD